VTETFTPYTYGDLTVLVRPSLSTAEQMIVREVHDAYEWDLAMRGAVDVGAHIGAWTALARLRFPGARVAAVEVDSLNHEVLVANVGGDPRVHVVEAHCGYTPGEYAVARHGFNSGSTRVVPAREPVGYPWTRHPAPARRTVEEVMAAAGLATVDVLKLDCEGGEVDIVAHLAPATLAGLRHVVGELHVDPDEFTRRTGNRLGRAGFHLDTTPHPANPALQTFHAHR
jgi:FkbM family methyltransferase